MLRRIAERIIGEENYYRMRFERHFAQDQRRNMPVLFVHQMGKVGSTTIVKSLRAQGFDQQWRIYQTHFLSPEGLQFVEDAEVAGYGGWEHIPPRTKSILVSSRGISKHWYMGDFDARDIKLLSLVRDPVATNLSGFFHNYRWWPATLRQHCEARIAGWQRYLFDYFLEAYSHEVPLVWFNQEMRNVFGVDVLAQPFDKEAGFQLYSEPYDLIVVKLESLRGDALRSIGKFLHLEDFRLIRSNSATDKWYADLYSEFKDANVVTSEYVDSLYASDFMRHFYTAGEIEASRMNWLVENDNM